MKILVDASRLNISKPTGTNNYLYNLVYFLSRIDTHNEYTLAFKNIPSENILNDLFNTNPNFKYKVIKNKHFWTQVGLCLETYAQKYDILFCPWQTFPFFHAPNVKVISMLHDRGFSLPSIFSTIFTCHFSHKIVTVSKYVKNNLSNIYFVPKSKITVIYEAGFLNTNIEHIPCNKNTSNYIFFIGTLDKRKNIKRMIQGFLQSKLANKFKFYIAGREGNDKSLISEYANNPSIKFLGYISNEDYLCYLKNAFAFVFVSLEEGFGIPPLEAMAFKKPVITSDTTSLYELYKECCLLADPKSEESIRDALNMLLDNELYSKYANLGFEYQKKFSWHKTAFETMTLFNSFPTRRTNEKKS